MRRLPYLALTVILLISISSCSTLSYYSQSISGGLEVLWNRQDIDELLANPDLDSTLRDKLQLALEIRRFSITTLGLPDNDSYLSYTDLKREHVLWNVFAAPEFSLNLKQWCFLFAGCVGYKGWFDRADAEQEAAELREQGFDVYAGGVSAYSTIGWFDDPLLNTFINRGEAQLAGLIFHELTHQVVYIKGDTAFNESYASTVEIRGVERWLETRGDSQGREQYRQYLQRRRDFRRLVASSRQSLEQLYQQQLDQAAMRERKAQLFEVMRAEYRQLKENWQGYSGYDRWFADEINNAKLGSVALYNDLIPAFSALLEQEGGDFKRFHARVRELAALKTDQRMAEMARLSGE